MPPRWKVVPLFYGQITPTLRVSVLATDLNGDVFEAYRHTPIYRSDQRRVPDNVLIGYVDPAALHYVRWRIYGEPVLVIADINSAYLAINGTAEPILTLPQSD